MNIKTLLLICGISLLFINQSCKKDKNTAGSIPEEKVEQLNSVTEGATTISTEIQLIMNEAMVKAIQAGQNIESPPSVSNTKSFQLSNLKSIGSFSDYGWMGPDFNGWYTRSFDGLYKYYEKVRKRDTIDYIRVMEYHGGDGSFENKTTTKYIKYKKNNKELYKGYSVWELNSSGYNEISASVWKIKFVDWNPQTKAGIYDWYWGVSENSGGNTVPLHLYQHLEAVESSTSGWLHCKVTWYDDDGVETWEYEYDTPFVPVDMPEIPDTPL